MPLTSNTRRFTYNSLKIQTSNLQRPPPPRTSIQSSVLLSKHTLDEISAGTPKICKNIFAVVKDIFMGIRNVHRSRIFKDIGIDLLLHIFAYLINYCIFGHYCIFLHIFAYFGIITAYFVNPKIVNYRKILI